MEDKQFDPAAAAEILRRDLGGAVRVLRVRRDLELDEGNTEAAKVFSDALDQLERG